MRTDNSSEFGAMDPYKRDVDMSSSKPNGSTGHNSINTSGENLTPLRKKRTGTIKDPPYKKKATLHMNDYK